MIGPAAYARQFLSWLSFDRAEGLRRAWHNTGIADNPLLLADLTEIVRFQSALDPTTGRCMAGHDLAYLSGRRDAINDLLARLELTEDDLRKAQQEVEHEAQQSFFDNRTGIRAE